MAEFDPSISSPIALDTREQVYEVFRQQIVESPQYAHELAENLWMALPAEERDAKQLMIRNLLGSTDLAVIAAASKALVLSEYLEAQALLADKLNVEFETTVYIPPSV